MAVAKGVTPLYVHVEGEASIDLLFGLWGQGTKPDHVIYSLAEGAEALRATPPAIRA